MIIKLKPNAQVTRHNADWYQGLVLFKLGFPELRTKRDRDMIIKSYEYFTVNVSIKAVS